MHPKFTHPSFTHPGILLIALALSLPATAAQVDVQTWKITGTVSSIGDGGLQTYNQTFQVGDAFEHVFTIDTGVPGIVNNPPPGDESAIYTAVTSAQLTIPTRGLTIQTTAPGDVTISHYVVLDDQWSMFLDSSALSSTIPVIGNDALGEVPLSAVYLVLTVPGDYPVLDPPPIVQPDPTWSAQTYNVRWVSLGEGANYSLNLSINSFQVVPEPTSLALLAIGGLVLARRRTTARDN